ncbi:MAG: hydrogenase maturation protease, partial [Pseudomonadales bacterium]|nr:hydrogenase maturation protease [Pseudomonadales bacterium]
MRVQPQTTAPWSESSVRECGERAGKSVVILGLGNVLLGDDGAGIHVIEHLRLNPAFPSEFLLIDGGTLSFSLLELVENARILVVVDAMELDAAPGTVRLFVDDDLDNFLAAPRQRSVH